MSPQQEADIILQQWQSLRSLSPDERIVAIRVVEKNVSREINPWPLAILISLALWGAIWAVAEVAMR